MAPLSSLDVHCPGNIKQRQENIKQRDTADEGPVCKVPYLSGSAQVQLIGVDRVALSFTLSPLDDDRDQRNVDGDDDDDGYADVFIDGLRAYLKIFITTITIAV